MGAATSKRHGAQRDPLYGIPSAAWQAWPPLQAAYTATKKARLRGPLLSGAWPQSALAQISAEALDALAGVLEVRGLGGVGNPECRPQPERRPLHHGDALVLQQLGDEILVVADHLAGRRGFADGSGAGRIDVERALRPRAFDPLGLVEHRDREIAPLLAHLVVRRNEILRAVERLDGSPLRDRGRVRCRLRLDRGHRLDQFGPAAGVADAPAGHAIGFRHTVHR